MARTWAWACLFLPLLNNATSRRLSLLKRAAEIETTTDTPLFYGPTPSPSTTPAPLPDFLLRPIDVKASFGYFEISWKATYNITHVVLHYKENAAIEHTIQINSFNEVTEYISANQIRKRYVFRLGGLYKMERYFMCANTTAGRRMRFQACASFLTSQDDGVGDLYNLTGIFLVLGISTIIMVVVMVCVGYEKLIHNKQEECVDLLCCRRRKKKKKSKGAISPEPVVPNNTFIRRFDHKTTDSVESLVATEVSQAER